MKPTTTAPKRSEAPARLLRAIAALALATALSCCLASCYSAEPKSAKTSAIESTASTSNDSPQSEPEPTDSSASGYEAGPSYNTEPAYEDERWPTNNSQLLAIPESQRWYNASSLVGTNCTVAGPVVNVYQATGSRGAPIFVQIGAKYPDPDCVEMLIWADQLDSGYEGLLNDISNGSNPWVSVSGYLSSYEGTMQFNSNDGPLSWTVWPDAN